MLKKCLFKVSPDSSLSASLSLAALRIFAGLSMAFAHGLGKLPPPEKLIEGVGAMGFPAPELFAWLAALSEFAGGILLAVGFLTRPAAAFMAITMFVAAFVVHSADPFNVKEMALLYFFISVAFAVRGANRISVDRFFAQS